MFVIYDGSGRILSTISGPDQSYGADVLDREGRTWLFLEGVTSLDPLTSYIDVATRGVQPLRTMTLSLDRDSVAADGQHAARVTGLPEGAVMQVLIGDAEVTAEVISGGVVAFSAAAPARYRLLFSAWPYHPVELVVVAS